MELTNISLYAAALFAGFGISSFSHFFSTVKTFWLGERERGKISVEGLRDF